MKQLPLQTLPEEVSLPLHYKSKSRHLDLNCLMREHFCSEEPHSGSQSEISDGSSIKSELVIFLRRLKRKFKFLALIALWAAMLTGCQPENHFGLHQVGDNYVQHYAWWYNNKLYNMNLSFRVRTYWHYRKKSKTQPYNEYVLEDKGFEYIEYVARALNEQIAKEHLSDAEMANFVLAFAQQSVPYVRDPIGPRDYPRYAIETLCDMGGDCEDKSAVCCSILLAYKIDAILVQIPGHEFVAVSCPGIDGYYCVYNGEKYFYGETTSSGWTFGTAPELVLNSREVTVLPVERTAFFDRLHPPQSANQLPYPTSQ